MAIQATGRNLWAQALGSMKGSTGTATAVSATTLTNSGATWASNEWEGQDVSMGGVVATVISNTTNVLNLARWETPGNRGGATAATPSTGVYVIHAGATPATWMALTANTTTPTVGGSNTTLAGEITTAGGGLVRALAAWGHTLGTNTYTLSNTFTANSNDSGSLPIVLAKIGIFNAQNGGRLMYETLLNATATITVATDNILVTESIVGT